MGRKNLRQKLESERKKSMVKRLIKKLVLVFFIIGIGFLLVSHTYSLTKPFVENELSSFSKEFLTIRELSIIGASEFADKEIRSFVNPIIEINPNIFTFPTENVKLFLATRPYIESAFIRKEMPNRIAVEIKEKKPVAILLDSELKLLDENGEVIRPMSTGENIDVPVISVTDDSDTSSFRLRMGCQFILLDNQSTPFILPSEIKLFQNHMEIKSLDLKTSRNEVPSIYISYEEMEKKILNLKKLWTDIVNKKENIEYVDARYLKGLSVKQKNN